MSDAPKVKLPSSFLRLGQQAPVDVYAKNGLLLLKKGHYVLTPEQRDRLSGLAHGDSDAVETLLERERLERAAQREKEARQQAALNPLEEMGFLLRRVEGVLLHGLAVKGLADSLADIADALLRLSQRHPDGLLAGVFLLPWRQPGSAFSLHAAAILAVLGRRLGWDEARLKSVLGAALGMNIAITALLNQLGSQREEPDLSQREALFMHPVTGSAMLREAGIEDEHLHALVLTHHEQRDGQGYPLGLAGAEIHDDACLLQLVDVLCTCRGGPHAPLPSHVVASLFRGDLGAFQGKDVALLVKELGIYPPGSFVRLASNEIAVVTHRGEKANTPRVAALRKMDGPPYADALLRDTRLAAYRIVEAAPMGMASVKPSYLSKLWLKS